MTERTDPVSKKIVVLSICAILAIYFTPFALAQSSTILNAQASSNQPEVGSILTVTLQISDVENLAGIDVTLSWNSSVLTITAVNLNLGNSHTNGVLIGSNLNYNPDTLSEGDIFVNETIKSASYNIIAQSAIGFTGSGTIANISFLVNIPGEAEISLQTQLTNPPLEGQNAENISHHDTADSVTAVPIGSLNSPTATHTPPTSPATSTSPNSSPSTASTSPTNKPADNPSQTTYLLAAAISAAIVILAITLFILRRKNIFQKIRNGIRILLSRIFKRVNQPK